MNTVLLHEARGKSFAVYRQAMRRYGRQLSGQQVLTKGKLRELLANEEQARALVGFLSTMGRDLRSTSMQWSYEGKKLSAAVRFLSWRPPWVRALQGADDGGHAFLPDAHRVADAHGLGRIVTTWWTKNAKYNALYEIHRLNVRGELERNAVGQFDDSLADVRFDFVRSAPDLAAFMIALRTEMSMRVVMPEIVPHTEAEPFMAMARFETGDGGNPHFHGFTVGAGGPQLGRVNADMDESALGDLAPASGDDDGTDPAAECAGEEAAPCDERASDGAVVSDCSEPEEKGSSPDVDPYESEPECDAHGGLASPAGLAAAASTGDAGGGESVAAGSVDCASARAPRRRRSGSFERKPLP